MSYRIGIDPGCSGAIVVMDDDVLVEWAIMPTVKVGKIGRAHV